MKEELLKNIHEFLDSGEENLKKARYNASVSDFFKAIVILCDYLIYNEIKVIPKSHNERFSLLRTYFKEIYKNVSSLFQVYIKSYNLRLNKKEADSIREYANELKKFVVNKE